MRRVYMFRISLFILCLISFFIIFSKVIAGNPTYDLVLIEEADRRALYNDKYWHTLLHYKKGVFGLRSLIDDPNFFLAPGGKHNPKAELEATIKAFFSGTRGRNKTSGVQICRTLHLVEGATWYRSFSTPCT